MAETNKVDTVETTETVEQKNTETQLGDDTKINETSPEAKAQKGYIGNLLNGTPIETSIQKVDDTQENLEVDKDGKLIEKPKELTEEEKQFIIDLEVEGDNEPIDFRTEDGKAKLKQYAQQGKHYSQNMAKVNQEKEEVTKQQAAVNEQQELAVSQYLRNMSRNGIRLEKPNEDPIYIGNEDRWETETEANTRFTNEKQVYDATRDALDNWQEGNRKYQKSYSEMETEFRNKNEDLKDPAKFQSWIDKNVNPLIKSFISCGSVEVPKNFLDMVKLYEDKDKIIKDAVDKALETDRKKRATPSGRIEVPKAVKETSSKDPASMQKSYVGNLLRS